METIIALPATQDKLDALKAVLKALKIDFRTGGEAANVITNSDLMQRIEDYEMGRTVLAEHSLDEIKAKLRA